MEREIDKYYPTLFREKLDEGLKLYRAVNLPEIKQEFSMAGQEIGFKCLICLQDVPLVNFVEMAGGKKICQDCWKWRREMIKKFQNQKSKIFKKKEEIKEEEISELDFKY
jgi:hypothetical protein